MSLPAPPLSVLAELLPVMMSLPPPPLTFSIPDKISLPSSVYCLLVDPRLIRLFLELNTAVSLPPPPTKRSLPKPPLRVSLPAPPLSVLAELLPVRVLSKELPVALIFPEPVRVVKHSTLSEAV